MEGNQPVIDIGYEPVEKKLIMVVDDESALQTLIFDTLEADYRILSAFNGREAITKAANVKPVVILMDVMMPDIGGYDAVKLLNSNPATRNIPVVVMTAQDFDDSTIQLIRQEPNVAAFVNKPFRPKTLREIIKSVLEQKEK
jgi:CheY-like chemotaxis protein